MRLKNRREISLFNGLGTTLAKLGLIHSMWGTVLRMSSSYPAEDYDGFTEYVEEMIVVYVDDGIKIKEYNN